MDNVIDLSIPVAEVIEKQPVLIVIILVMRAIRSWFLPKRRWYERH